MGAAVVVAARPQARQPVGVGSLPHVGGRHADPRARYVRALLSHGLRRQGGELRRHVHGRHSLEQHGATIRSNDKWSRDGGRCKAMSSTHEEIIMRAVHVLAICAVATIGSAASAQEIDWKKVDEARRAPDSRAERADAVVVQGSLAVKPVTDMAIKYRVPMASTTRAFADIGGLMSFGADGSAAFRHSARFVSARPLDGSRNLLGTGHAVSLRMKAGCITV